MHLKMAEALEMVHTHRRGLLQGLWWPVGPKLFFGHMAAPVPEIMDRFLKQFTVAEICLLVPTHLPV
jgi:hypothetical protein